MNKNGLQEKLNQKEAVDADRNQSVGSAHDPATVPSGYTELHGEKERADQYTSDMDDVPQPFENECLEKLFSFFSFNLVY